MSQQVVTRQTPLHAYRAEPVHAGLVNHPDFGEVCGHIEGERVCILPEAEHPTPDVAAEGDRRRAMGLGFALEQILNSDDVAEIHRLARSALDEATRLP